MPAWVLKLGGSLEGAALLGPLLRLLAEQGRPLVIVLAVDGSLMRSEPGRRPWGLDEDAAHWLAIGPWSSTRRPCAP